jgi:hypothetical protein
MMGKESGIQAKPYHAGNMVFCGVKMVCLYGEIQRFWRILIKPMKLLITMRHYLPVS